MIKIKLSYIQIREALSVLKGLQQQPMDAILALVVARQGRTLSGHAMDSEEVRVGLMRKYADKDEAGDPIQVPALDSDGKPTGKQMQYQIPDTEPLNIEWTEALKQEIECEVPLLSLVGLDKSEIALTPAEMMAIEPLLEE